MPASGRGSARRDRARLARPPRFAGRPTVTPPSAPRCQSSSPRRSGGGHRAGSRTTCCWSECSTALSRVHDLAPDGEVIAVTHGGVVYALEGRFGSPFERLANLGGRWIDVGPGGELRGLGDRVVLVDPASLPAPPRCGVRHPSRAASPDDDPDPPRPPAGGGVRGCGSGTGVRAGGLVRPHIGGTPARPRRNRDKHRTPSPPHQAPHVTTRRIHP